MYIFPAIDLYDAKAVRLLKGDYEKMTVYSDNPVAIVQDFESNGISHMHLVDLEGAKSGDNKNYRTIAKIRESSDIFIQLGGGIRSVEQAERYLGLGINRIILGTAAIEDENLLAELAGKYQERIAVGVDVMDGIVKTHGWRKATGIYLKDYCEKLNALNIRTIIATDISKDGAMKGTNIALYEDLQKLTDADLVASGGIHSIEELKKVHALALYGAIIGKAYYTGDIKLNEAVKYED
ncbi:MAG: 1-(5-phosphoribosyl)-5-[(5-phosphoribosylamino)methylideneamino]imidazole-4-carboxamide isomerase [Saccharofermentanales bacterium]|nr:1-(5-phosphoribosyl)-5-[(5-phosphoribosylamino)methylideneamino]imidazole-4-carboxamide isomerase [Bacillota bacterium]NLB09446.1 1-(5-phosphoribosyl)-5-[(5-phosphoribosylamino)methylideneamino]imidazole-4-carboxamide isomerase [Clostridiales bacterium]